MMEEPTKDCISKFPLEVIHEILGRLTIQDVGRSSCLSKPWKSFCASLPWVNIDSRSLSYDLLKDVIKEKVKSMSLCKEHLVMHKMRLHLDYNFVQLAQEDIESCIRLVSETSTIKEIDFQITNQPDNPFMEGTFFHHIYRAETLTMLRLSGLRLSQPVEDMKLSNLQILRLEGVEVDLRSSDNINWLERVEIQAPSLEKLVFSEKKRTRLDDEFYLDLRIDSETCEALRELTLCNSTMRGKAFSTMFSKCSNVESLVLDRCVHFYKIKIASQRLRKLVLRRCFHLVITDIEAPNLTSFNFCNYLDIDALNLEGMFDPFKHKHKEEIIHQQECMLDLNSMLWTKNIWISLWVDKFKDTEGQKMVIYPKVLKKKSYTSSREQYFATVTDKIEVEAFLSSTGPMLSICNSYKSLNETE
ncbi:Leucine-rich repeat domain superfamily [Sesbania bispinosa]|nr:Leucine-rich repeat domain superfamily [Sesbania bispinosa]